MRFIVVSGATKYLWKMNFSTHLARLPSLCQCWVVLGQSHQIWSFSHSLGKPRARSASKILNDLLTDRHLTQPAAKTCCFGGARTTNMWNAATQHGSSSTDGKGPNTSIILTLWRSHCDWRIRGLGPSGDAPSSVRWAALRQEARLRLRVGLL